MPKRADLEKQGNYFTSKIKNEIAKESSRSMIKPYEMRIRYFE